MAGSAAFGHAAGASGPAGAARPGVGIVGVVLAAGEGRRLRPLTALVPKPLCPVGDRPLLDHALDRLNVVTDALAVNLHHGRSALDAHLDGVARRFVAPIHRSVEEPVALGTAGALGQLRRWIDGRATLVVNADGWTDADLATFVAGWDGVRPRVLITPDPRRAPGAGPASAGLGSAGRSSSGPARFGPGVGLVASLLPWADLSRLEAVPSGLYEAVWREAHTEGRLDVVVHGGRFVDCGTAATYLQANLEYLADAGAPPGASVIGAGARVEGTATESVVWPGSVVASGEHLVRAVRAGSLTVEVRPVAR